MVRANDEPYCDCALWAAGGDDKKWQPAVLREYGLLYLETDALVRTTDEVLVWVIPLGMELIAQQMVALLQGRGYRFIDLHTERKSPWWLLRS